MAGSLPEEDTEVVGSGLLPCPPHPKSRWLGAMTAGTQGAGPFSCHHVTDHTLSLRMSNTGFCP